MVKVEINGNLYDVETNEIQYKINGQSRDIDISEINEGSFHILINNVSYSVKILSCSESQSLMRLKVNDREIECRIKDQKSLIKETLAVITEKESLITTLKSPMPGLIEKILVKEGDEVTENMPLVILNAMKMENTLKATKNGVVKKISVSEGNQVEKGKELLQF